MSLLQKVSGTSLRAETRAIVSIYDFAYNAPFYPFRRTSFKTSQAHPNDISDFLTAKSSSILQNTIYLYICQAENPA